MMALLFALASTVVDGPCGVVDKLVAQDAVAAVDIVLREAAATAETAGDSILASKLLIRLRDRSRDAQVQAEAAFSLETLDMNAPLVRCDSNDRQVVVSFHEATFLTAAERERLSSIVIAELRSRDVPAVFDASGELTACDVDERCIRRVLVQRKAGAYIRLLPARVAEMVNVDVNAWGFKGNITHRFELDADSARWSPVLNRAALDDVVSLVPRAPHAGRRGGANRSGSADPVIAGVAVAGVGALTIGTGVALLVAPGIVGAQAPTDVERVQTAGIATIAVGAAVIVVGVVAVALVVDTNKDR